MIIFGWGHVTRKKYGKAATQQCRMCGQNMDYQLCRKSTWFTLFFIPVIPYNTVYCLECPNCKAYMEVDKQRFQQIKQMIDNGEEEAYEYAGKTPTQIAFLKSMRETTLEENGESHI